MKNRKGFTLVELLSVIAILAIVMGIVSIAYVKITEGIDKAYYEGIEQSLLQSAGEYYTYNRKIQPQIFGTEIQVKLSELRNGEYISEVLDREGNKCSNDDSYVGAYIDSLDKIRYYVCLDCGNKHKSKACSTDVDYTLKMSAILEGTKEIYEEGKYTKETVGLNFKTYNDIEEVIVEKDNEVVGSCRLTNNSCKVLINQTGNYTYYGQTGDKRTPKESIEIKIDQDSPTFDIVDKDDNSIDNNNVNVGLVLGQDNIITTNVKNIRDDASGIKTIRYSFEKGKEKYQNINSNEESFVIEKILDSGKYKLIVEVVDWAGNKKIKEVNYDIYYKLDELTPASYCKLGLVYNGDSQILTEDIEGIIFSSNTRTNAGSQDVTATLASGYRWSDNTTGNKKFSCSIAKATPTLTLSETMSEIAVGQSVIFTEKANVAGSFENENAVTSKVTVSPASYSNIAADTEKSVTITGIDNGLSTITVTFTPTDTTNYNTKTATYTVNVNSISIQIPTASYCKTGLVYDGSSQILTKNTETGYTFSTNTRTNAGSQDVTATLASGYIWSDNTTGTKTFSCSISPKPITYKADDASKTYDGTALTKGTASIVSGSLVSGHTATFGITGTITNYTSGGVTNTLNSVTIRSVTIDVSSNYTIIKQNGTLTINKAPGQVVLSETSGLVAYPSNRSFTVTTNRSGGTLSVSSSNTNVATATISGTTVTVKSGITSGNATITVTSAATANYNQATATYTVAVQSGTIQVTATNYTGTYDGSAHGATVSSTTSGATIKYGTTSGTYNQTTMPTRTNAGTTTVYYQITASGYTTKTGSVTITINQRDISSGTVGGLSEKTYTGSAITQTPTLTVDSKTLVNGTDFTYTTSNNINAGTATVTITGKGNYTGTKTGTFTINKAQGQVVLSETSGTITYPSNRSITVTTNRSGGTLSVSSSAPNVATATISGTTIRIRSGTKAGAATIMVSSSETPNYNHAIATYRVRVQSGTIQVTATNYTGTYDGSAHGATVSSTTSGATIKYGTTSGTYNQTTMPTRTNVGTTTVYYQITASGYTTKTGSVTITINKATLATTGTCNDLAYNGSYQTLASGGEHVSYTNNSKIDATATGYEVTVTADENYAFSDGTTSKELICKIKAIYRIHHMYQMNDQDETAYSDDPDSDKYGYLGSTVDCPVREHDNFKSPQQETLVLNYNINNLYYYYDRKCFGNLCEYCEINDSIGACLYMNREQIGINNWNDKSKLFNSGLSADTDRANFRYIGANPDNYVSIAGINHRIIGIFSDGNNGVDYDGMNHRIRVINPVSNGAISYGHVTSYNSSELKKENNNLLESTYKDIKDKIKEINFYHTGGDTNPKCSHLGNLTAEQFLDTSYNLLPERKSEKCAIIDDHVSSIKTSKTQIFTTQPSDVLLSTGNTDSKFKENKINADTTWILVQNPVDQNNQGNEWIADVFNSANAYFMCNHSTKGIVLVSNPPDYSDSCTHQRTGYNRGVHHNYRSNFELMADTLFCGGSGTEDKPYKIGFGTCNSQ